MNRRAFLPAAAGFLCLPHVAAAYPADMFSPSLWRALRDAPEVVILNFRASWSLTCQIKADILAELVASEPTYARLQFVDVDWDTFGPSVQTGKWGVTRNSTLLVMKAGREVARLEAEPYPRKIRALLDRALAA